MLAADGSSEARSASEPSRTRSASARSRTSSSRSCGFAIAARSRSFRRQPMPLRHNLLAASVALLWGVNFVAIDVGLETFPPLLFVALRFALTAFPAVLLVRRPAVAVKWIVAVGFFLSVGQFGLLFVAIHIGMPAGLSSLVDSAAGRVHDRAGRRVSRRETVARSALRCGRGFRRSGIDRRRKSAERAAGCRCPRGGSCRFLGCQQHLHASGEAVRGLRVPDLGEPRRPDSPDGFVVRLRGIELDGARIQLNRLAGAPLVLYIVVVATLFGFGAWTWLLARHSASNVAPFSLLAPVAALVSTWLVRGERPTAAELAGGLVILAGLALAVLPPRRLRAAEA